MVNVYHPFRFFFVLFLDNLQKDACNFGTPKAFRNLYIPYLYCAYLFIFSFFILIFGQDKKLLCICLNDSVEWRLRKLSATI